MDIDKVITDNPIMDSIVYYVKILGMNTITKNETEALKYETLESLRDSDLYLSIIEGSAVYNMFLYPRSILITSGVPEYLLEACIENPINIPANLRSIAFENMKNYYVNNYDELNNYYRMLNGLPNYGDSGIFINADDYNINLTNGEIDYTKPIHLMNENETKLLEGLGVISSLKNEYPEYSYLYFLGSKKIPYHVSRRADRFALLQIPDNLGVEEITSKWRNKYENIRVYTLKTIYSEALKYNNDYFDNFIQLFIKIQTMIDIIIELPDFLIKKDFFDVKSIKYMFESSGIAFYEDIPIKYQIAMIKNLNNLIKYKSTSKNMVDICSLFGFNNVELFKYYLLKDRNVDGNGNYTFIYKDIEDPSDPEQTIRVLDDDANYTLKFVRVPIDDLVDDYIRDSSNFRDYDELTSTDPYWSGDKSPDEIKAKILSKEFNIVRSKYISIDSIYEMSSLSFELSYFFNIIFESNLSIQLMLPIPTLDPNAIFKLTDAIFYLYLLMYEQNGIIDDIMSTQSQILHIRGFNFKANLSEIASWLATSGKTLKDVGIENFKTTTNIVSYSQLLDIYTTNKNIHDHLINQMNNANDISVYRIYKKLYESLMITDANYNIFTLSDGNIAPTYTDYFNEKSPIIYNHILNIRTLDNSEKPNAISETMSNIILSIEEYLDTTSFKFVFQNIPQMSSELIKKYVYKVINFFKSYKVDFTSINTIYKFDDKLDNKIRVLDYLYDNLVSLTKPESYNLIEKRTFNTKETFIVDYKILDNLTFLTQMSLKTGISLKELRETLISLINSESDTSYYYNDSFNRVNGSIINKDNGINITDQVYIYKTTN